MGANASFDGCITQGPWGGSQGENWNYMPKGFINKINIVHGRVIDAITFQSDCSMGKSESSFFGGVGGDQLDTVWIDYPNEYLTSISGTFDNYKGSVVVKSLCFGTNLKHYGPYGSDTGTRFSYDGKGGVIVGFHGRVDQYLDAVGIYVMPESLAFGRNSTCENNSTHELSCSMSRMPMPREAGPWDASGVTMPSTSKSNRQKPKQQWQVKQPTRNWLELPSDVMANILFRVGVRDILENAQKVCTDWRKICKDPSMWRVICMDYPNLNSIDRDLAMCKHAVDRSQGQLIDITIGDFGSFGDDELLQYVADRSSQIRRLKIISSYTCSYKTWIKVLKKLPLLEELSLYSKWISIEVVETVGCYCPLLKTLKLNIGENAFFWDSGGACDKIAITIGENLHELEHLELIGNNMSNIGLQVILDGCRHLKSLDLRTCWFIDLKGDPVKRCSQQIKCLKLPDDSLDGCQYIYGYDSNLLDDSDDELDEYLGYYDYI